jgi:hypothetical protein
VALHGAFSPSRANRPDRCPGQRLPFPIEAIVASCLPLKLSGDRKFPYDVFALVSRTKRKRLIWRRERDSNRIQTPSRISMLRIRKITRSPRIPPKPHSCHWSCHWKSLSPKGASDTRSKASGPTCLCWRLCLHEFFSTNCGVGPELSYRTQLSARCRYIRPKFSQLLETLRQRHAAASNGTTSSITTSLGSPTRPHYSRTTWCSRVCRETRRGRFQTLL